MADRSVVVRLRAEIGQYQAAMAKAKGSTTEFGREVTGQGKSAKADIEAVGRAGLLMGGAMALGMGKAISVGMGFEKQMSGVRAVSGATAEEMTRLSEAALAAGSSTKLAGVTASDAAAAEAELVKAGVSVSDVLGGALMGSLTLAAAGQIDFANAATIAAQAMNIFDLKGGAVTHIADVLAAAANKSAADVGSLGDALRQGGLVASQYGLDLEDTVGTLSLFADNALVGSDAGTALKTMLQRLSPISAESASLMEELGFSAYDLQGNFIGIGGVADELQTSLAGLTQEQRDTTLAQLFGSDAVRGANVLYEAGAEGIREYTDAVNDEGAAARMAAIQNDNLAGDVEALGGALESAFIENGSKATGALRGITQGATDLVVGFGQMPDLLQTSAMGVAGIATAGTLAVGVIGTLGPKVREAQTSLRGMGTAGKFAADNMGKMAGAIGAVGAGFAAFAAWEAMMASAKASAEDAGAVWKGLAFSGDNIESLDDFSDALGRVNEEERKLRVDANTKDAPWDSDLRAEMRAGADELGNIGSEMARVIDLSADLARNFDVSRDAAFDFIMGQRAAGVDVLAEDYDSIKTAMREAFGAMPAASTAVGKVTEDLEANAEAAKAAEDAFKDLRDAYRAGVDPLFGMLSALESNQDAQDELTNAYERNADGADDNNVSARDLADMQRAVASTALDAMSAAQDLAHAVDNGTVSVSDARDMLQEWVEKGLITEDQAAAVAEQFGVAAQKAEEFAGDYVATAQMRMDASAFHRELDLVKWRLASMGITGPAGAYVLPPGAAGPVLPLPQGPLLQSTGGRVPHYLAAGGRHPWARGTDTIPAMLSPDEYTLRASSARKIGYGNLEAMNRGDFAAVSQGWGGSQDNSRSVHLNLSPTIVESQSPRATASEVLFEARVMAAGMGG